MTVHVPPGYVAGTPAPLLILLHGYSASGSLEELYFDFTPLSDARGFLYAYPDGTVDSSGNRFWNATNACCNLYGATVDDSTYLSDLVTEISARYSVDPRQVFFVGHSNGGFMAYRMACDHGDRIAAIASLAGAMWLDVTSCPASATVAVLEIHGTGDEVIGYDGGVIQGGGAYPGAVTTVTDWVTIDGCTTTPDRSSPPLDLTLPPGNDTSVVKYAAGCKPGGHAELWTIDGGPHIPPPSTSFAPDILDVLFAHPKP